MININEHFVEVSGYTKNIKMHYALKLKHETIALESILTSSDAILKLSEEFYDLK